MLAEMAVNDKAAFTQLTDLAKAKLGGNRKRRKVCAFCVDKVEQIDYKDAQKLKRYLSERSKAVDRPHQRRVQDERHELLHLYARPEAGQPLARHHCAFDSCHYRSASCC